MEQGARVAPLVYPEYGKAGIPPSGWPPLRAHTERPVTVLEGTNRRVQSTRLGLLEAADAAARLSLPGAPG